MTNIRFAVIVSFALAIAGCSGNGGNAEKTASVVEAAAPGELPLPAVPDELLTIEERAGYLALHFWDGMDFADKRLSLDTAFVEQNFVNFISVIPSATEADAEEAFSVMLRRASAEPAALQLLRSTAESYLNHPNSPMRDEAVYIVYLRALLSSGMLGEADRVRADYALECAMKNRPGTQAADFRFAVRGGGESTLHGAAAQADVTLLMFYDPECEHCKEFMERAASVQLRPGVQILAIDAEDDRDAWERTSDNLPAAWAVGYALTRILDEELYTLPASPTIYLLDRSGSVIAKDADPERALAFIAAR